MNKNNGISAFKISQTQHKRMKMALWGDSGMFGLYS